MFLNLAIVPQVIVVDKVSCEIIGAEDVQPIAPSEKDYIDPHLHQSFLEGDKNKL